MATIKRADAEDILSEGPQKGGKWRQERKRTQRIYCSRVHRGRKLATIRRSDAEDILNKGPQREGHGDNKESGRRGCTDQGLTEGGYRCVQKTN